MTASVDRVALLRRGIALEAVTVSNPSFLRKISSTSRMDFSSSTIRILARLGMLEIDVEGGPHAPA